MKRFIDNSDGTVTDTKTGLMWQQETVLNKTWQEALDYVRDLKLAGYDDWRLPNIHELQSIVDYGRYNPSIDAKAFLGTVSSDYWSSTTYASSTDGAWCVDFYYGGYVYNYSKTDAYAVRAVRKEADWTNLALKAELAESARELARQQEDRFKEVEMLTRFNTRQANEITRLKAERDEFKAMCVAGEPPYYTKWKQQAEEVAELKVALAASARDLARQQHADLTLLGERDEKIRCLNNENKRLKELCAELVGPDMKIE